MLYFKIICKTLKNYDFEDNKELKRFMNVVAAQAEEFSAAYEGSANFYLTQVKKDNLLRNYCSNNGIELLEIWENDYKGDTESIKAKIIKIIEK